MARIESVARLRELLGAPSAQTQKKFHRRLNERARAFIARSPLALLATCDRAGRPAVSPRGDGPGFAQVTAEGDLLLPERPGNRLIASLQNLVENPRAELLFLVPGTGETLRVGGAAELRDDADLRASLRSRGRDALLVVRLRPDTCFFHCAKAFLRSELWNPATWPPRIPVSFGEEIAEEGGLGELTAEALDAGVQGRYRTDL